MEGSTRQSADTNPRRCTAVAVSGGVTDPVARLGNDQQAIIRDRKPTEIMRHRGGAPRDPGQNFHAIEASAAVGEYHLNATVADCDGYAVLPQQRGIHVIGIGIVIAVLGNNWHGQAAKSNDAANGQDKDASPSERPIHLSPPNHTVIIAPAQTNRQKGRGRAISAHRP